MLSIARNNTGYAKCGGRAKVPWAGARNSCHVACSTTSNVPPSLVIDYQLRTGRESDAPTIKALVSAERMNPLGLKPERFTVAVAGTPGGGERVVGIVQVTPLGEGSSAAGGGGPPSPASVELRSLVVARGHRRRGLGARLVRHRLAQLPPGTQVWLTTVERREAFYNKLGFERQPLTAAPGAMLFEVAAGLVVARLVAKQQLVLLRGTAPGP